MVSLYKLKRAEEYESGLKTCFESENHNMNTFHTFKSKTILFCSKIEHFCDHFIFFASHRCFVVNGFKFT